jgi:alpha-beta hydrolase superfamily lysophospholipase
MSSPGLLPFERAFRGWSEEHGIDWERLTLSVHPQGEWTRGYRFTPASGAIRHVLAVHGAGNDALFAWIGLFKRLLSADTGILTFDLPGHGRDTKGCFDPDRASDAILAALVECGGADCDLPVHAVAVSLGASLLLGTLPAIQNRLASAALIVAPLRIELSLGSVLNEVGLRTLRVLWREREHYGLTGLIPSFGPFKRDVYPLRLPDPAPPGAFGYIAALNAALAELRLEAVATAVRLPVLLLYGEDDRIVPPQQGVRLAGRIAGSELTIVPGGTHLSTPLEPLVTERLVDWLERHR